MGVGGAKWDSRRIENQELFSRVILKMTQVPQVIICCLHGAASGGGFALALAADMRIAAESTKMNAAFIAIGLSGCELGTSFHLPRLCGLSNASEILMTGDFVNAQDAFRLGIVNKTCPDEDLYDTALVLARKCLKSSWLGLRLTKKLLRGNADGSSLEASIHSENLSQLLCLNDKKTQEHTAGKTKRFMPKQPKQPSQSNL